MIHIERSWLSPDELEHEVVDWHWEPGEIRVLKGLVTLGQVKVESLQVGASKRDIVYIRSSETVGSDENPFKIETLPFSLRSVIEEALVQGEVRVHILTLLYMESNDRRGPGDVGYPCGESVSNAHYRKDEVALQLTGDKPTLSTTYLGEEESGWVVMDQDPSFPHIQII